MCPGPRTRQGQFPKGSIRPRGYMAPDAQRSLAKTNVATMMPDRQRHELEWRRSSRCEFQTANTEVPWIAGGPMVRDAARCAAPHHEGLSAYHMLRLILEEQPTGRVSKDGPRVKPRSRGTKVSRLCSSITLNGGRRRPSSRGRSATLKGGRGECRVLNAPADGVTGTPEAFQPSRASYGAVCSARRAAWLEGRRSSLTLMA